MEQSPPEGFRLSPQQHRLWLLQEGEGGRVYGAGCVAVLVGPLRVDVLKSALDQLAQHCEILRTTFQCLPGMTLPVQVIHEDPLYRYGESDAVAWETGQTRAEVGRLLAHTSYDLEQGPLFGLALRKLSPRENLLVMTLPALLADGPTMENLLQLLAQFYATALASSDRGQSFSEEMLQYADVAQWLHELLEVEDAGAGKAHWQNASSISGLRGRLSLEREPPLPQPGFQPATLAFEVAPDLARDLRALAARQDKPVATVLLAGWQLWLLHHLDWTKTAVSVTGTGRNYEELVEVSGLLAKELPLAVDPEEAAHATFLEWLESVSQSLKRAEQWQEYYQWSSLAKASAGGEEVEDSVYFHPFAFGEQTYGSGYDAAGVRFRMERRFAQIDRYKLKLLCEDGPSERLELALAYDPAIFAEELILLYRDQLLTLLHQIPRSHGERAAKLSLLSENERRAILGEFNDTATPYPRDQTVHRCFSARVTGGAGGYPVVYEEGNGEVSLPLADLERRARWLAQELVRRGIGPADVVGLLLHRSAQAAVAIMGILGTGAAYLPLDPALPEERLGYLLEDSAAGALITRGSLIERIAHPPERTICLDRLSIDSESDTPSWPPPSPCLGSDLPAYIIYTSGSTGLPKGCRITHRSALNYLFWVKNSYIPHQDAGYFGLFTSLSFDFTLTTILGALLFGQGLHIYPPERDIPAILSHAFSGQTPIDTIKLTPSHIGLLEHLNPRESNIRTIILGGEALSAQQVTVLRRIAPAASIFNEYGPTEATVGCILKKIDSEQAPILIGKPIANCQAYVLDVLDRLAPIGVMGDLVLAGDSLARGYDNRPDLTAARFVPSPFGLGERWYRSGDLARRMANGELEFLGRGDQQVKIRGFRIELGEVEARLLEVSWVRQAVVNTQAEAPGEARLLAYLVPGQKPEEPENALLEYLNAKLPEYMIPAAFLFMEKLPLTANGKVDRAALPSPEKLRRGLGSRYLAPRDAVERELVQIWERVLKRYPIGIRDTFFELGGHSLLAVQIMSRIQACFDLTIPLALLFQSPTIEELAVSLRRQDVALDWHPLVPIQPHGARPPLFLMPGAGGNVVYFHHLAQRLGSDQPVYGLQSVGLDGRSEPLTDVGAIAALYIEKIREVQARGPYYLGGHSFGARVASEMVQQLTRVGERVALLAVFDTTAPVFALELLGLDWDETRWMVQIAMEIEHFLGKKLGITHELLRPLAQEQQLDLLVERLKAADWWPAAADPIQIRGFMRVYKSNRQTQYVVSGEPHPVRIALFRAEKSDEDDEVLNEGMVAARRDSAWGWAAFSDQPVDVHDVPGDHVTMMTEPHVKCLAKYLKARLDAFFEGTE